MSRQSETIVNGSLFGSGRVNRDVDKKKRKHGEQNNI